MTAAFIILEYYSSTFPISLWKIQKVLCRPLCSLSCFNKSSIAFVRNAFVLFSPLHWVRPEQSEE